MSEVRTYEELTDPTEEQTMSGELTEHQIDVFKKKLIDRFAAVRREISEELSSSDEEQYIDLAGRVHDIADESLADLLVDLDLASIDRHVQEIRAIDTALLRIADGSYGECSDCGESIATERLEVVPTAERCTACQERHDHTYMHEGRPTL